MFGERCNDSDKVKLREKPDREREKKPNREREGEKEKEEGRRRKLRGKENERLLSFSISSIFIPATSSILSKLRSRFIFLFFSLSSLALFLSHPFP